MRIAVILLCAGGTLAAAIAYRSDRRLEEVKRLALVSLRASGSSGEARRTGEAARREALRLLPGARLLNPDTDLDVQRGLFLEPNRRRAERFLRSAIAREPENVFLWIALTRRQVLEGRLAAAGRSYARARELDPNLPPPR